MLSLEVLLLGVLGPLLELLVVLANHVDEGLRVSVLFQLFYISVLEQLGRLICINFSVIVRRKLPLLIRLVPFCLLDYFHGSILLDLEGSKVGMRQ